MSTLEASLNVPDMVKKCVMFKHNVTVVYTLLMSLDIIKQSGVELNVQQQVYMINGNT